MTVSVIGAGLAGAEAAWALSRQGFCVHLHEMKPLKLSPAHSYSGFAELVCSNSFKGNALSSAAGLLKAEMRLLGSLVLEVAEATKVKAGGALAVDREAFSDEVTRRLKAAPNIEIITGEVTEFPQSNAIIATGPLTSDAFAEAIKAKCGEGLSFYDAAAPIITLESVDLSKAFFGNRYGKDGADYLNFPMSKEEYDAFYDALVSAQTAPLRDFDRLPAGGVAVYEGCMPVEILAKRGRDSVRYGCMKPVGFTDPATGKRPYAVVQLRPENDKRSLFNIVGFQTNLKFGEQERVFRLIPGLGNAEFARYGVMHRNTFLDSPRLLDRHFMLRGSQNVFFAGQITGTEGYMESAAGGIIAGLSLAGKCPKLPETCMIGALTRYISDESVKNFQPMGANMGLLPALEQRIKGKQERYEALSERALGDLRGVIL